MKRVTVKDKIILHLNQYKEYVHDYEVPSNVTQDGIATDIGITRSHVAITMKDLKKKEYIGERLARVKGLTRQRKVYFLTERGDIYTKGLRQIFYDRTVMFKDIEGNETEIKLPELLSYLYPYTKQYISIYDVVTHLDKENIFDTATFLKKVESEKESKAKQKKIEKTPKPEIAQKIPTPTPTPTIAAPPKPTIPPPPKPPVSVLTGSRREPTNWQEHIGPPNPNNPSPYYNYYPRYPYYYNPYYHPYYYSQAAGENATHNSPHNPQQAQYQNPPGYQYPSYFPYYYYSYDPLLSGQYTNEERKTRVMESVYSLFGIGVGFSLLSLLLLILVEGYCFLGFFIPVLIGFIFGILGFSYGFSRLPFIGTSGRRLLLAMGIFYVGMMIITMETLMFNFIMYLEIETVGPVILAIAGFFGVIIFVKKIKIEIRRELTYAVGIFCVLFGILSGLLLPQNILTNPFVFAPFWILFGVTSILLGNELMRDMDRQEKPSAIIKYSAIGTGAFLFLVPLTRLIMGEYTGEPVALSYLSDACWLGVGGYLVSIRFAKGAVYDKMFDSIKISLPLGIGVLFIIFGVFLVTLNKFIEGVVEIILGIIVIRYGFSKSVYSKNKSDMLLKLYFPIFLIISQCITFYLLLSG
jgi:DNA-binding PadR family transcriptional regulator